jgi:hypothetical protein
MEETVTGGPELDHAAAMAIGNGRDTTRSVLELAAVKALEVSGQATGKTEQLGRRSRRKYRRKVKKQARKLENRVAAAAKRLQVAMPVEKQRRRGRRTALFLVVVGGGIAIYLAWRSRQQQGEGQAAEAGPAPDAFGAAAVEQSSESAPSSVDTRST